MDVRSGTEAAAVVPTGRSTETSRPEAGSDGKPARAASGGCEREPGLGAWPRRGGSVSARVLQRNSRSGSRRCKSRAICSEEPAHELLEAEKPQNLLWVS